MADEFVDFYEALNLPLEADRKEVRRRINEVYLEAQRNLDHRNFQTRVKHQEMFEVLLPRARYILLDDARRDEYDQLVKTFRAASAPAPPPVSAPTPPKSQEKSFGIGDTSGFKLAEAEEAPAGKAPPIEAIPQPSLDPAQMAAQREASWAKWKLNFEEAAAKEEVVAKPVTPAPVRPNAPLTSSSPQAAAARPTAQQKTTQEPEPRPRPRAASFDFGEHSSVVPKTEDDEETAKAKALEIERKKTERKRTVLNEILDSVSLKGTVIGALGTAVPLGALLIFLMGYFYPREGGQPLPVPSTVAWIVGIAIVCGGAFIGARQLASSMRNKANLQLSMLSLEDLLRQVGRTY